MWQILNADSLHIPLAAQSVQCVVTSPPYWGLRDYGTATWVGGDEGCDHTMRPDGGPKQLTNTGAAGHVHRNCKCGATRIDSQIGLEATPEEYVKKIVAVFEEVKRVLRDDGTVFCNLGDSYNGVGRGEKANGLQIAARAATQRTVSGLKPKDLVGIPWRVAFALQADGWYLRSAITWCKLNPMPESVTDRPTKATEMIFLLAKSERYFYDAQAVAEPAGATNGAAFSSSALTPEIDAALNTDDRAPNLRGRMDFSQSQITIIATVTQQAKRFEVIKSIRFSVISEQSERQFVVDLQPLDGTASLASMSVALQGLFSNDAPIWATIVDSTAAPGGAFVTDEVNTAPFPSAGAIAKTMVQPWFLLTDIIEKRRSAIITFHGNESGASFSVRGTFRPAHVPHNNKNTRNMRDYWLIATQSFPDAHFATFPEEIAIRCIKAGTSEKGACKQCGAPWERVTEVDYIKNRPSAGNDPRSRDQDRLADAREIYGSQGWRGNNLLRDSKTTGWQPGCKCDDDILVRCLNCDHPVFFHYDVCQFRDSERPALACKCVGFEKVKLSQSLNPCIVLDPFSGAGTVPLVADKLNRRGIGLELKADYCKMAHYRCYDDAPLLAL